MKAKQKFLSGPVKEHPITSAGAKDEDNNSLARIETQYWQDQGGFLNIQFDPNDPHQKDTMDAPDYKPAQMKPIVKIKPRISTNLDLLSSN